MLRRISEFLKSLFALIPEHWKQALSENGEGSFTRYACLFILINAAGWVWFSMFKSHVLPDFNGLTLFVSSCLGVLYGTNQAKNVVAAWKGGPDPGTNPGQVLNQPQEPKQ